ncbi:MAG: metalloregulator ArsR/SmtB family transcription factor [Gammaproteobacteria bacterium]|nr:metalloregulator ArsR/SmtB family transcription factor [Gammaproteobacteria bacterium]
MRALLDALRAAGEPSRLRLLAILARNELTVSELTRILGQSQPRVSRHLKLLCEAGLVDRHQEGTWVFYRVTDHGIAAEIARSVISWISPDDSALGSDLERLESVCQEHAAAAAVYFRDNAKYWDRIRRLYVAESKVERAMENAVSDMQIDDLLDLGTGTGRVLEVFGSRIKRGLGIDLSREMLAIARAHLESVRLTHCQVRHGDIFHLPGMPASMDVVVIHHVLHFLDNPAQAVAAAARTLKASGRLLIVDFAPHQLEFLRTEFAHRRLGFSDEEVRGWLNAAGLPFVSTNHLTSRSGTSRKQLTVSVWCASAMEIKTTTHQEAA